MHTRSLLDLVRKFRRIIGRRMNCPRTCLECPQGIALLNYRSPRRLELYCWTVSVCHLVCSRRRSWKRWRWRSRRRRRLTGHSECFLRCLSWIRSLLPGRCSRLLISFRKRFRRCPWLPRGLRRYCRGTLWSLLAWVSVSNCLSARRLL